MLSTQATVFSQFVELFWVQTPPGPCRVPAEGGLLLPAGMTTTPAPSQHRQPSVSPLSLGAEPRRPQSQQMSPTLSPLSPITQVGIQVF